MRGPASSFWNARAIPLRKAWRSARMGRGWRPRVGRRRCGCGMPGRVSQLLECRGHTDYGYECGVQPGGHPAGDGESIGRRGCGMRGRAGSSWNARAIPRIVQSVVFSPDGTRLATAQFGSDGRLWDPRNGPSCSWNSRAIPAMFRAWRSARMGRGWRPRVGIRRRGCGMRGRVRQLMECKGHTGGVRSVAFSPDGTRLATASRRSDGAAVGPRTGQQLLEYARDIPTIFSAWRSARMGLGWRRRVKIGRRGLWDARRASFAWNARGILAPLAAWRSARMGRGWRPPELIRQRATVRLADRASPCWNSRGTLARLLPDV